MPEDTLQIVRRGIEAFNARDIDALIELFDREAEVHSAFAVAVGGTTVYRGHEGLRRWHQDLEETWAEISLEAESFVERGEKALVYYVMRGRGRLSGVEVAMPIAHRIVFRDGLVVELKTYADRTVALSELGVAEEALEPIG